MTVAIVVYKGLIPVVGRILTIKLIEDKNIIRQLTYELKKAIKKIKDKVDKSTFDKLSSKIGKINELPNAIKLSTPFTT